jgi:glutamyl-tRNA reductase
MTLIACGLNHKTAPIRLREQLAVTPDQHAHWLQDLTGQTYIQEAALLSTCNRTEFYCDTDESEALLPWFAERHTLAIDDLAPHFYCYQDSDATRHAMRG